MWKPRLPPIAVVVMFLRLQCCFIFTYVTVVLWHPFVLWVDIVLCLCASSFLTSCIALSCFLERVPLIRFDTSKVAENRLRARYFHGSALNLGRLTRLHVRPLSFATLFGNWWTCVSLGVLRTLCTRSLCVLFRVTCLVVVQFYK